MNVHEFATEFEDEVRRIARQLWPSAAYSGAIKSEGREYDGVFPTEFTTHVLECTTHSKKDKAEKDVAKIIGLIERLERQESSRTYQGWFITRVEPTADQRLGAAESQKKNPRIKVEILSLDQFRCRLIDTRYYIELRSRFHFGSIADPETGNTTEDIPYVPLGIHAISKPGTLSSTEEIALSLREGKRILILGDYGAGKSMTLKQVHKALTRTHFKESSKHFPIYINLRNHQNQDDPAEALHRHSMKVGFPSPDQLVRAWRAGYGVPLLDGFDEIAKSGWSGNVRQLRQARYNSLALVRNFLDQTPKSTGVAVVGREHFFDNTTERDSTLGVNSDFTILGLSQFSDEQIASFLRKKGWNKPVPEWLPARPLLLGYLASKGLLLRALEIDGSNSPALAWDQLLDKISEREAKIEAGISGDSVRAILERLATISRKYADGIGPMAPDDLIDAFRAVCHGDPDESGMMILQRLPGLGAVSAQDGSRQIIDQSLADAARAGDVVRFIRDPHNQNLGDTQNWQCLLQELGISVAGIRLSNMHSKPSHLNAALRLANHSSLNALVADIVRVAHEYPFDCALEPASIREQVFTTLELSPTGTPISGIEFQDCLISSLELPPDLAPKDIPIFRRCAIESIEGRVGKLDIPNDRFPETTITHFSQSSATTAGIMALPVPLPVRVLLSILKKVYLQKGAGRKQSALLRGLEPAAQRYVPDLIDILERNELVAKFRFREDTVWMPVRANRERVTKILSGPTISTDPILKLADL